MEPTNNSRKTSTQKRKELIVSSAIDCFINKGFHQTSIRDIAKQAGISLGNFYNYFDSKEILIKEIAVLEASELSWVDELHKTDQLPVNLLKDFINEYLNYVEQLPNVVLTIEFLAESIRNPDIGRSFELNRKKLIFNLCKILSAGVKINQFDANIDKQETAKLILDMIEGLAMRSALAQIKTRKTSRATLHAMIHKAVCC